MHLEISIENEQPLIFSLNKPRLMLGSHESCDVVIPQKNISRKHLLILTKNGSYYVVDQGSTNGSFLNDVKLVPGKEVEFTTFFPLRLGTKVLVTLNTSEAEIEAPPEDTEKPDNSLRNFFKEEAQETTKMISLKDLNKASTAKLVKKKAEVVAKKISPKEQKLKDQKKVKIVGLVCLGVFALAAYYNMKLVKDGESESGVPTTAAVTAASPVIPEPTTPILRVADADLPLLEKITQLSSEPKCSKPLEKDLCLALPAVNEGVWGVVQDEKNLIIYADGFKYRNLARAYVKGQNSAPTYKTELNMMMIALWLKDSVPVNAKNLAPFTGHPFTIAMVDSSKPESELLVAAVFAPESLTRLRNRLDEAQFTKARTEGALTFSYALDYLRFL